MHGVRVRQHTIDTPYITVLANLSVLRIACVTCLHMEDSFRCSFSLLTLLQPGLVDS
jgi:hypothetical protein